ncbi:P-loop containing nucleoside triphosphate hydrolase protein [Trametes punicea]|nr:P-loop containing nucleoside triphosphate hydrolase protein [Trametes punicea]
MSAIWHVPTWLELSQFVLDRTAFASLAGYFSVNLAEDIYQIWQNTLAYPACATVLSAFVLSLQLIGRTPGVWRVYARLMKSSMPGETGEDLEAVGNDGEHPSYITRMRGPAVLFCQITCLLSCMALLALSIAGLVLSDDASDLSHWIAFGMTVTYTYASLLASMSVISRTSLSNLASGHNTLVLLVAWGVYFYRDLWPLATFTLSPLDAIEGSLLWVKIALLTLAAVIVPLFCPRQYVPVDPKDPAPEVNPEQTASIFSLSVYTFLDDIRFKAYRMPHLPWEELAPLAHYDYARNLLKRSFPYLDPFQGSKQQHIFLCLMKVFLFTIPGAIVVVAGAWCGQVYMKAQLSVKREMSNARAPVLGHFGAAIAGVTSIRAYGAQRRFKEESFQRIDRYVRAARTFYNLNRWRSIRIEALGALFAACLAAYLVYGSHARAANTGFSLNMAVGSCGMILFWIRTLNEFEVNGNRFASFPQSVEDDLLTSVSLERIQQYVTIEQEPKPTTDGIPPAYWPASGALKVEKLSARYSMDSPRVLHEISFDVKAGERVGIVGRTGSGKSSLTLALLRLIFTEGKVYYDGITTDSINLDALRSNVTIIPQVAELLSGTLRQNLDPFSQYDDAVLNDALRAAGLFSLQGESDEGRITLDSPLSSGGSNLSVGQRQILALARAILRQSKLLILDEATSAIDYEIDTIIQNSLRRELGKDVTILTIAHRLQTIMDADKILVHDAGHIALRQAEFGSPSELLKNENGMLRALVDESSDRDALYAMAKAASSPG